MPHLKFVESRARRKKFLGRSSIRNLLMALPYKPLNVSVIEIGKLWEMKFLYEEKKTTEAKNYLNPLKFAADIDLFPGG